jgi:dimethylglycine dehydrogenase
VRCDIVVNAGGTYARQIGAWTGLDLPVFSAAHQYLVTEPLDALAKRDGELPLLRDSHATAAYFRQEQHAVLMGFYEKADPHLVWVDGTPWEAVNELFEPDLDAIMPSLETAMERFPLIAGAGIRRVVNGAIPYTADGTMLLGPAPGLPDYWCACGVSVGVAFGPGVGKYLAQAMVHGAADINLRPFDPRRFGGWADRDYALAKVREDYVLRHQVPFPGRDRTAARPARTSSLYGPLKARGAVFEQLAGWERPFAFALATEPQGHIESFRRSEATRRMAREVVSARARVGMLDLSGFAKLEVSGPDAGAFLDRVSSNRLPKEGRVALSYLLTETGTIDAELTITRRAEDRFLLLYAALDEIRVIDRLTAECRPGDDVAIANLSDSQGCIVLAGPHARDVLARLTTADVSGPAFPWFTARDIAVAGRAVTALRVSLTGELGWELHARMQDLPALDAALRDAGDRFGIVDFGTAALNAMRIEKAFKGTRELNAATTLAETDMLRFAVTDRLFTGRDAMLRRAPPAFVCAYLSIDSADADCHGSEAVLHEGRVVGTISSGAFSPTIGRSLAFAFLEQACARPGTRLEVLALGEARPAAVLGEAAYDPSGARMRL